MAKFIPVEARLSRWQQVSAWPIIVLSFAYVGVYVGLYLGLEIRVSERPTFC